MGIRHVCVLSIVTGILGDTDACLPVRARTRLRNGTRDTAAREISQTARGSEWFKFDGARRGEGAASVSCVSCHTLLPYALARPVLRRVSDDMVPTEMETKVLEQVRNRVSNWERLEASPFADSSTISTSRKRSSRASTRGGLERAVLALEDSATAKAAQRALEESPFDTLVHTGRRGAAEGLVGVA